MFKWVGKYSFLIGLIVLCSLNLSAKDREEIDLLSRSKISWKEFSKEARLLRKQNKRDGVSYMISGSLALAGGLVGEGITKDPLEKAIYTVFQTIGIGSVGYGGYLWKVGGEERSLLDTLNAMKKTTSKQKTLFLRSYIKQRAAKKKNERIVKAVTHGLVAALNIYSASRQDNESMKNGLYFIGGVNLLASVSFTFDF